MLRIPSSVHLASVTKVGMVGTSLPSKPPPPTGSTLVVRRHRGEVKRCHRDRRPFCSSRASGTAESTRSKRRSRPQLQPPPKGMRRQIRKRLGRKNGGGDRAPVPPAVVESASTLAGARRG